MRDYLEITGGRRLAGSVCASGAKNSALPLLIAALLSSGRCVLSNVPELDDIGVTVRLLRSLGASVERPPGAVVIDGAGVCGSEAPYGLVKALRASFWVLGPLLARTGMARVSLPGGDAIGTRPVDLHLQGLSKMGAEIVISHGVVIGSAPGGLRPARIKFDYPSVGATHQLLMTASLVPGETVIEGAAREPEIVEVAEFLSRMGAEIEGAGTPVIRINGRRELGGAEQEVCGDRIEAATYLIAAAITGGTADVGGVEQRAIRSTLDLLESAGCTIAAKGSGAASTISISAPPRLSAFEAVTAPYPGVATDVQPLLMAACTRARGVSRINETVFESRFGHVAEYRRFGASIEIDGRLATISGVPTLSGAPVEGMDIRAAAGLVLMGLAAEGKTEVYEIHHLDRGYGDLVGKMRQLGAGLLRVPVQEESELIVGC